MNHYPDGHEEDHDEGVDPVTGYSKLMTRLRDIFYRSAGGGDSYLLVYWHDYEEKADYKTVKKGEYPWNVHDRHMANASVENPCFLAMALNLRQAFETQLPDHMRAFTTMASFGYAPFVNMPDRNGMVPEERRQKVIADIVRPKPELRVYINNEPAKRDPAAPKPALRLV